MNEKTKKKLKESNVKEGRKKEEEKDTNTNKRLK